MKITLGHIRSIIKEEMAKLALQEDDSSPFDPAGKATPMTSVPPKFKDPIEAIRSTVQERLGGAMGSSWDATVRLVGGYSKGPDFTFGGQLSLEYNIKDGVYSLADIRILDYNNRPPIPEEGKKYLLAKMKAVEPGLGRRLQFVLSQFADGKLTLSGPGGRPLRATMDLVHAPVSR